jgi:GPH family glycoside/pentoside/hexuronide:cation symporter
VRDLREEALDEGPSRIVTEPPGRATNGAALSTGQIVAYSLPAAAMAILLLAVGVYLPNFYTDELGLSAGMLAWVLLAGRLWDAVTDPVMGFVSDRTRSRWGRRRPYLLLAAAPIWLCFYLMWSPGRGLGESALFLHLLLCYLALYTFTTVFWIPYISLGVELTPDYHERTRLFGGRQAFYLLGTAVGMLAPPLFVKAAGDTASGYARMSLAFGALCAALILVSFARVRERERAPDPEPFAFVEGLRITFRNRAFVVLMLTYLVALAGGSFIAPLTLYVAKYVIRAEWVVPIVMIAYLAGSIASVALWVRLSRRIGKNRTWTVGMLLATTVYATSFVYREGTWELWIVLAALVGAANGCTMTLGASISADVIDADELATGRRREGAFMGIWSFMDKAAIGIAIFVGMQGLERIGYRPNVEQTPAVVLGIKLLYCIVPAVFHVGALLLFQRFPMTAEVHAEIRAKLEQRALGVEASEAIR